MLRISPQLTTPLSPLPTRLGAKAPAPRREGTVALGTRAVALSAVRLAPAPYRSIAGQAIAVCGPPPVPPPPQPPHV